MLEKQTGVDQRGDKFWGANYTYSRKRTVEDADSRFMKFKFKVFCFMSFIFSIAVKLFFYEHIFWMLILDICVC